MNEARGTELPFKDEEIEARIFCDLVSLRTKHKKKTKTLRFILVFKNFADLRIFVLLIFPRVRTETRYIWLS